MIFENGDNRLQLYPVPTGAVLQEDYTLNVRPAGGQDWQELKTYRVKVDMHDVRTASMAYFDFAGKVEVEITFPQFCEVYRVDIRPLALRIVPVIEPNRVTFSLDRPVNISVEINRDRFHNLHLFAGTIEDAPDRHGENTLLIQGSLDQPGFLGDDISRALEQMPAGRTLYVEAGLYYITECIWHLPARTNIYLEGGVVLIGGLVFENGEDLHISGRGVLYLADFARFSGTHGIRISHCRNVSIDDLIFVNPPHYTVCLGGCENVVIRNIKTFSCEGWSDGIDMMSCKNVLVEGGFLRTSDDCVAVYGSRWDNFGDSRDVTVRNISLWADVAHPLIIGTHGDHRHNGDVIENIIYENIDILEHHEFQSGYLGTMTINAGDKNTVRNVVYRNIRIEPFEHGKVLDFQVKWNQDYNPAPGRRIENVLLEDIYIQTGDGEEPSVISGYSKEFYIQDVTIRRMFRDGKQIFSLEDGNIKVGCFVRNVKLKGEV